MDRTLRIPLVAGLGFVAGFGVADVTGVRPLGGLVLLAAGAWCAREALPIAGARRTGLLLGFALVAFVAAHGLGLLIGAWPAAITTGAVVALAAGALVREQRPASLAA